MALARAMRRRRRLKNQAHFRLVARVDRAHQTRATLTIDRESGVATIRRANARRAWRFPLAKMVELTMSRLMREEAELRLGTRGQE